ncbi:hypothetical protein GCM10027053_06260 [Intrasporangium mesophilum]
MVTLLAAQDGAGTYLDWGVVHISLANLLVIVLMVLVFFAALLIPFPKARGETSRGAGRSADNPDEKGVDR